MPLGVTAFKQGATVGIVFGDPSIDASDVEIYRNHTRKLLITGTGFTKRYRTSLFFRRPLISEDVVLHVSAPRAGLDVTVNHYGGLPASFPPLFRPLPPPPPRVLLFRAPFCQCRVSLSLPQGKSSCVNVHVSGIIFSFSLVYIVYVGVAIFVFTFSVSLEGGEPHDDPDEPGDDLG